MVIANLPRRMKGSLVTLIAAIRGRRVALGRIGLGLGSSMATQLFGAVQAFALVPLFLSAWGVDTYGRWLIVTAAVSYLSLMDGGGQNYFANGLGVAFARGERSEFVQLLSEAVSLYVVLALCAVCCGVGMMGARHFGLISLGANDWRVDVSCILTIHLLGLHVPRGVYATVYRASRMFSAGASIHNTFLVISTILQATALVLKGGPISVAGAILLSSAIAWLWTVFDSRRRIPWCRDIQISGRNARQGLRHLRSSLGFWAISLGQTLAGPGMILVLASRESAKLVGLFSTHRTLSTVAAFVPNMIQSPVQPELTFLFGAGKARELRTFAVWLVRGVTALTGVAAFFVLVTAHTIYPAWCKGKYELNVGLLALLLIQGIVAASSSTCTWPMMSANRHIVLLPWTLARSVTSLLLCVLIIPRYGLMAPAIAGCVTEVVLGWLIHPLYASRFLGIPLRTMARAMAEPTVAALLIAALGVGLAGR